ncbi:MAG: aquaporin family protein [Bacteroidetes bacterium]|nr:aquaporin family protein [Bacteroidota bacterium]
MKKYITEMIGTFFLVFAICLTGNPLAIGSMLMVMVHIGGHISGAHYNPAVTIAVWIRKKIEIKEALIYILVQLVGATLAATFAHYMYGKTFPLHPDSTINPIKPVLMEMVCTFALAFVVLNVATHSKTAGNSFYGLAIGFTVMACAFCAGKISGGAFNPAVGTGMTLIEVIFGKGTFKDLWLYIVGPVGGACIAGILFVVMNPEEK